MVGDDEHTFGVDPAGRSTVTAAAPRGGPAGASGASRHRPTERARAGEVAWRPQGRVAAVGAAPVVAATTAHRARPARSGCGDGRSLARAAAVRRRHRLLAVATVALLGALAAPWGQRLHHAPHVGQGAEVSTAIPRSGPSTSPGARLPQR